MNSTIDSALIFAAGLGSRMLPITENIPKPVVRINNFTLIDIVINQILKAGIENIFVNTCYKAEMLESHLKKRTDCKIRIFKEEKLLETAGSLLSVSEQTGKKTLLTCNADTIWLEEKENSCIKDLIKLWSKSSSSIKLAMLLSKQEKFYADSRTKKEFTLTDSGIITYNKKNPTHYYMGTQIIDTTMVYKKEIKIPFPLSDVYKSIANNQSNIMAGAIGLEFKGKIVRHVDTVGSLSESREYCSANMITEW